MQLSFIVCQSIDKRRKIGAWFWPAFTSKQLQTKTFVCVLFGSEGRWAGANANKMLRQLFSYSRPYSFFLNRSPMASSPWVLGCMGVLSWDWDWSADFLSTECVGNSGIRGRSESDAPLVSCVRQNKRPMRVWLGFVLCTVLIHTVLVRQSLEGLCTVMRVPSLFLNFDPFLV